MIGVDAKGEAAIPNGNGVILNAGAKSNLLGTNGDGVSDAEERNIISGNTWSGIYLLGIGTTENVVSGNYIGVDETGTHALGNGGNGVFVDTGASFNRIGTDGNGVCDELESNIISGNGGHGVALYRPGSDGNVVAGNFIGTDVLGVAAVPNSLNGVLIGLGAKFNRVGVRGSSSNPTAERNVISGNAHSGIFLDGAGTDHNVVAGNLVGTSSLGHAGIGNAFNGIAVHAGRHNVIGTNGDGVGDEYEGNVASGNGHSGVLLAYGASFNRIAGNRLGTTVDGILALPNGQHGVLLYASANSNIIGSNGDGQSDDLEGNVISGNGYEGIYVTDVGTDNNVFAGNLIGVDADGKAAIPNLGNGVFIANGAKANLIGTNSDGVSDAEERNTISGNTLRGVFIYGEGTDSNVVAGNFIGTDRSGVLPLGNASHGVAVAGSSSNNVIGTNGDEVRDELEANVISANGVIGVVVNVGASHNKIAGNYIGTTKDGDVALGNVREGIMLANGSHSNIVGTDGDGLADEEERNVISGNGVHGVLIYAEGSDSNVVAGNYIGTDKHGNYSVPNLADGVRIASGAKQNRIGTNGDGISDEFERNLISGNGYAGVNIFESGSDFNVVAGNFIGTDAQRRLAARQCGVRSIYLQRWSQPRRHKWRRRV